MSLCLIFSVYKFFLHLTAFHIAFWERLSMNGTSIFRYNSIVFQFPSSDKYIFLLAQLCPLSLHWGRWFIYVSKFWKHFSFLLPFFSSSNSDFLFSFLQICEKCCSIFHVPLFLTNIVQISNDIGHYLFCCKCWLGYLSATQ